MSKAANRLDRWTTEEARELYGINSWGRDYFGISETGEAEVYLRDGEGVRPVSLAGVIDDLNERGIQAPILLRFKDLLDSQITRLNESFLGAMKQQNYRGTYRGVFPIKVNQQQQVVEEITAFGRRYHYGLEAGSKPELIAALAYMHGREAYIVCNGYKDTEFIDLALRAVKMGLRVVLVVEMPTEVDSIIERSRELGVRPILGVRARLSSKSTGHWAASGGDRSVFGLNVSQIVQLVDRLRGEDMLDCLQMLHYHQGSQIPNIRAIRRSVAEAARVYVGLVQEGARMGLLDLGGGLAVDYDGSQTNFSSSSNYTIAEYAADLVEVVMNACDNAGVDHPDILSESGRAVVAYYSVLVMNVLDVMRFETHGLPEVLPEGSHEMLCNLFEVSRVMTKKNLQECYNDALFYRDELRTLFTHGAISLRERALGEEVFWAIMSRISQSVRDLKYIPEDLQNLGDELTDFYYGNFSVFQSLPDAWAIDQLFPVMPLHRLAERPTRSAVIADITCDCDGRLDRFIDLHDVKKSLPVHELRDGEEYLLGVFLVGAYQETLGDLHNLLGDTNVVSVRIENGKVVYDREIEGDSVADVLSYVEYDPAQLVDRFRKLTEAAVREGRISARERKRTMDAYRDGLRAYTYYVAPDADPDTGRRTQPAVADMPDQAAGEVPMMSPAANP